MPTLQFATLTPQCLLCLAGWYNSSSVLGLLLIITWSALNKNRYLDRAASASLEVVQAGYEYLNPLLGSKQNSAIGIPVLIPDFRH